MDTNHAVAVFGGGCFWCTEAVFERLKGVLSIQPGYTGGQTEQPTYESICSGTTGHAEVIRIEFDPAQIAYQDLLTVFFSTHDPTTRNRQGNDVGTQYRSIILTTDAGQKRDAEAFIGELSAQAEPPRRIVTEVEPLGTFYEAEDYHHEYYRRNGSQPYCQFVVTPKLEKFASRFAAILKN
jgi:peptide-methionine (S)-S-oxide reductase